MTTTAPDHARLLRESGLLDPAWYAATQTDLAGTDPVAHYLREGWRLGHDPNPYFSTRWYLHQNPDVARTGWNPLLHYLLHGEAEGRAPSERFDLPWYANQHTGSPQQTRLAHFLTHRRDGRASPLPEFDPVFYLASYPDIRHAGVDPAEHFLLWGFREQRNPAAGFDTGWYQRQYLPDSPDENPLLHYRRLRGLVRLPTAPPPEQSAVFAAMRRNTRPGPDFEAVASLPASARRRALVLAYYLPQFHPIPENNAWWGEGFTEWHTVARGLPRFAGQYQPRTPRDLGHYNLATHPGDTATMHRQVALARGGGVHGFVHYFYWFNGRRMLDAPTEAMLADPTLDFPFCLMWANENWTRSWDGSADEVLLRQEYRRADEAALLACWARHFQDHRYIRLDGRPLLMIYRAGLIPDTGATLARWRQILREVHGENPVFVMAQAFDAMDPREFGCDGAIEFPPHKLAVGLPLANADLTYHDPAATAQVYRYDDMAAASLAEPMPDFPLIKTAIPGWDNDARRPGAGMVVHGATPARYQAWLAALVDRAQAAPFLGTPILAVNAWNEWAEGAYLEPDAHYGAAFLNATARAVTIGANAAATPGLLLVGHDAFPAGAQMLLLHLAQHLTQVNGLRVEILLLGDGALLAQYQSVCPTHVLTDRAQLAAYLAACTGRGCTAALVNSAASAWVVPELARAGLAATWLVHELPGLLAEKGLTADAGAAVIAAARIVFPATCVRDAFGAVGAAAQHILPQGSYRATRHDAKARRRLRASLGLTDTDHLVLGAGYGDLRKGFDLFLHAFRAQKRRRGIRFCWLGAIDPTLRTYLGPEIDAAVATGGLLLPGHQDNIADWLNAADLFVLPSREDPFPSVVLEALCTGLACIAFAGSGGAAELLEQIGQAPIAPLGDIQALSQAITARLAAVLPRATLARQAQARFDFAAYADRLRHLAMPGLASVSVVVPSYNYARFLPERLSTVFDQTHPVQEVIVLDDASTDGSAVLAQRVAADHARRIHLVRNHSNSGSVFRQWQRGAALATGEFLWIAEADDTADPALLARLLAPLQEDAGIDLALCDSHAIDATGAELWANHQTYFAEAGVAGLATDRLFAAADFARLCLADRNLVLNASAVVWRRTALLAALDRCKDELADWRMAGDWRLYLEVLGHSTGRVAWVAAPLNGHRRHTGSVTASLPGTAHRQEVSRMHQVVNATLGLDPARMLRQAAYLDQIQIATASPKAARDVAVETKHPTQLDRQMTI